MRWLVCVLAITTALAVGPSGQAGGFVSSLEITLAGSGNGQVDYVNDSGTPVTCQPACSPTYTSLGIPITPELTALAAAGSAFAGWTVNPAGAIVSGCGPAITCEVNMSEHELVSVTATFSAAPNTVPLTVLQAGGGQGTVTSAPPAIDCGATCAAAFNQGTVIALTAIPAAGSTFGGWSGGGCTGTGTCTVTMNAAQIVTATFGGGGGVQATVDSTRIRKTGPVLARRQLKVTVTAGEDLRRIAIRIRRGGVTIQSKTVRDFDADTAVLTMNVRNRIALGRAQLQVVFTNESGAMKTQTRGIRIPRL